MLIGSVLSPVIDLIVPSQILEEMSLPVSDSQMPSDIDGGRLNWKYAALKIEVTPSVMNVPKKMLKNFLLIISLERSIEKI
jgi:hypothetical protein